MEINLRIFGWANSAQTETSKPTSFYLMIHWFKVYQNSLNNAMHDPWIAMINDWSVRSLSLFSHVAVPLVFDVTMPLLSSQPTLKLDFGSVINLEISKKGWLDLTIFFYRTDWKKIKDKKNHKIKKYIIYGFVKDDLCFVFTNLWPTFVRMWP